MCTLIIEWDISATTNNNALEQKITSSHNSNSNSHTSSNIIETITLHSFSPRLDFRCEVDWHERHKFLKVMLLVIVVVIYYFCSFKKKKKKKGGIWLGNSF